MPLRRAVPDGFMIDDFTVDHEAGTATCPAGITRPMVERSIAWMTRGARRVPYRGVASNHAWWVTRAAGINLQRLLKLGLTRQKTAPGHSRKASRPALATRAATTGAPEPSETALMSHRRQSLAQTMHRRRPDTGHEQPRNL